MHILGSPEKRFKLAHQAVADNAPKEIEPDPRFADSAWDRFPCNVYAEQFLATQNWWDGATTNMPGLEPKHAQIVNFAARQRLDMMSPSNFATTNPQVQMRTRDEGGQNLIRGARYWIEDFSRLLSRQPRKPNEYNVGQELATMPEVLKALGIRVQCT